MVGINIVSSASLSGPEIRNVASECSNTINRFKYNELYNKNGFYVYDISYPNYPVKKYVGDEYIVFIEGHIYDYDNYAIVAERINGATQSGELNKFQNWLSQLDGDFNVYRISKDTGHISIFSDVLGRLPLYYYSANPETKIVSRSIPFIKRIANYADLPLSMDDEAIAQTLLLNYPLGTKTHFEEIFQSGPAAHIKMSSKHISYNKYHDLRFDKERFDNRSLEENASVISELLLDTCRKRTELPGKKIVSLSGGKDSRLMAGCLDYLNVDFTTASFYDNTERVEKDVSVAREVARELEADWLLVNTGINGANMKSLLHRKGGLNFLKLGYMVGFFEGILDMTDNPIHYFTGDVGDLLDSGWSIYRSFPSVDRAADWIIESNSIMPPEQVSSLTGFDVRDLKAFIVNRLNEYPESEIRAKVEHFLTRERGFNLDFHGEDRNRTFFWTHAPLNSWPVIKYLLSTPRDQKKEYALCIEVFNNINEDLLGIDYAPYSAPLGSYEQLIKDKLYQHVPNQSYFQNLVLYALFKERGFSSSISDYLEDQLSNVPELDTYLSRSEIEVFIDNTEKYSATAGFSLATITTLIEYKNNDATTLDEYEDISF